MASYKLARIDEMLLVQITAIYNYYIKNSTATFHKNEISPEGMKEILFDGDPRFPSFAILDGEELCGYCLITRYKKREAYDTTGELTVYLKPGCEKKGIGSFAVRQLEETAVQNGFHTLLAGICAENTGSIRLFSKLGYEKCAHFREVGMKFGRLLDTVYYQKMIGE